MNALSLSDAERKHFHTNGFVVLDQSPLIHDSALIEKLKESMEKCFKGEFDWGIYPDECYGLELFLFRNKAFHVTILNKRCFFIRERSIELSLTDDMVDM